MKNEKGITLIILMITLLITLLLGGITLNSFLNSDSSIYNKIKQKEFEDKIKICKNEIEIFIKKEKLKDEFDINNINIGITQVDGIVYNSNYSLDKILENIDSEFLKKIAVYHGELYYIPLDESENTQKEINWADNFGIKNINER